MIQNIIKELLRYLIGIIVVILAIIVLYKGGVWAYGMAYDLTSQTSDDTNTAIRDISITIPQGSSTEEIANILSDDGVINNAMVFRILAKFKDLDGSFEYGDYTLNTGMSDMDIMEILTTEGAKKETVTFTIPEGYSVEQIADRLEEEGICDSTDFLDAVENGNYDYPFLEDLPDVDGRTYALQGYLFPSTYEVYADASAEDIVSTMLSKFNDIFTEDDYDKAEELGMTVDQIVTIASIIEKEVKVADERELVASVIYNRLDAGMNLQMCSTVQYALGGVARENLTLDDLEVSSPYNTYKNAGLPVGPIANPGEASIEAALNPANTSYLYFVLSDTTSGEHQFSTNYDDFLEDKAEYKAEF